MIVNRGRNPTNAEGDVPCFEAVCYPSNKPNCHRTDPRRRGLLLLKCPNGILRRFSITFTVGLHESVKRVILARSSLCLCVDAVKSNWPVFKREGHWFVWKWGEIG